MKRYLLLLSLLTVSILLNAQYEQKFGIDLAVGGFKTFGKKYASGQGPYQMPNYKPGLAINIGVQLKISEHFSLAADFGILAANEWNYKTADKPDYLQWELTDTAGKLLAEGHDYLDLRNYNINIIPKYYFSPGKKWDPYLSARISINSTSAWFENNLWAAQKKLGLLPPEESVPYNDNIENSVGFGFSPCFGMEFSPTDQFHFYMETCYNFFTLDKNKFKYPSLVENFKAVLLQVGCRWTFIKSKEL